MDIITRMWMNVLQRLAGYAAPTNIRTSEVVVVPIGSYTIYRRILYWHNDEIFYYSNIRVVEMDVVAWICPETYSTMIPIRFVGYVLDHDVYWCQETRIGTIDEFGRHLTFISGSYYMTISGVQRPIENLRGERVQNVLLFDRMFIPLRAVGEAFGHEPEWLGETRTALLHIRR